MFIYLYYETCFLYYLYDESTIKNQIKKNLDPLTVQKILSQNTFTLGQLELLMLSDQISQLSFTQFITALMVLIKQPQKERVEKFFTILQENNFKITDHDFPFHFSKEEDINLLACFTPCRDYLQGQSDFFWNTYFNNYLNLGIKKSETFLFNQKVTPSSKLLQNDFFDLNLKNSENHNFLSNDLLCLQIKLINNEIKIKALFNRFFDQYNLCLKKLLLIFENSPTATIKNFLSEENLSIINQLIDFERTIEKSSYQKYFSYLKTSPKYQQFLQDKKMINNYLDKYQIEFSLKNNASHYLQHKI